MLCFVLLFCRVVKLRFTKFSFSGKCWCESCYFMIKASFNIKSNLSNLYLSQAINFTWLKLSTVLKFLKTFVFGVKIKEIKFYLS